MEDGYVETAHTDTWVRLRSDSRVKGRIWVRLQGLCLGSRCFFSSG